MVSMCQRYMHQALANDATGFFKECGSRHKWIDAGAVLHGGVLHVRGLSCIYELRDVKSLVTYLRPTGPGSGRTLGVRLSILFLPVVSKLANFAA